MKVTRTGKATKRTGESTGKSCFPMILRAMKIKMRPREDEAHPLLMGLIDKCYPLIPINKISSIYVSGNRQELFPSHADLWETMTCRAKNKKAVY